MAFLLTFDKSEKEIFAGFWIGLTTFPPSFDDVIVARSLKERITKETAEGGPIKLAHCTGCGQRIAQYDKLRQLVDDKGLDLILEQEEFNYIRGCFKKFERVFDELMESFAALKERFDQMKPKDIGHWQRLIEERDRIA